jgi:hypothetical protein
VIVESLAVLAIVAGGGLLVRTAGVRGWAVPLLGLAVGLAVQVVLTAALGMAGIEAAAWLPLVATALFPAVWWLRCRRAGEDVGLAPAAVVAVAAGLVGAVAVLRAAHLVNATPDSFRYLTTTGLLGTGRLDEASAFLLESRLLTVPAMHAPATLTDELYLRALTPIVAVACLGVLAWLVQTGLRGRITVPSPRLAAVAAVALLASNNRFVFHAFYLNGHLLLAMWFLLLAGIAWLLLSDADLVGLMPGRLVAGLVIIMPAVVLTRPDAGLMALLVSLPLVVAAGVTPSWRFAILLSLGGSIAMWQGYLAVAYLGDERDMPTSVPGLLALGLVIVGSAVVVRQSGTGWLPRRSLGLVEGSLWAALGVAVALDPRLLLRSARATLVNVFWDGGWGSSLLVLATLVVGVLLLTSTPGRAALRFPVTTLVPLSILLAYLRESAYREGPGDSLNRMLLQFVPIAILLVLSALATDRWRWPGRHERRHADAVAGDP